MRSRSRPPRGETAAPARRRLLLVLALAASLTAAACASKEETKTTWSGEGGFCVVGGTSHRRCNGDLVCVAPSGTPWGSCQKVCRNYPNCPADASAGCDGEFPCSDGGDVPADEDGDGDGGGGDQDRGPGEPPADGGGES